MEAIGARVAPSPGAPRIRAEHVRVEYDRTAVIDALDLDVEDGEIVALCGPNGSGKSTLLRALAGLHRAAAGRILVNGRDVRALARRELACQVAFLPQQPVTPDGLTVREVVAMARHPYRRMFGSSDPRDRRAVAVALARAEVEAFEDRPVDALSGGERQRVWLALALAQETPVLLLDEPTTFLDPHHQIGMLRRIRALARELGLTVIWVLHDLNQAAAHSDRMVLMQTGSVAAAGPPADVLTETTVRRVFHLDTLILPHPETGRPLCVPRG